MWAIDINFVMFIEGFLKSPNVTTQNMGSRAENNSSSPGSEDDSLLPADTGLQSMFNSTTTGYLSMGLTVFCYFRMEL